MTIWICKDRRNRFYAIECASRSGCRVYMAAQLGSEEGPFEVRKAELRDLKWLEAHKVKPVLATFTETSQARLDELEAVKRRKEQKAAEKRKEAGRIWP